MVEETLLVPQNTLAALWVGALAAQVEAASLQKVAECQQVAWRCMCAARRGEVEGECPLARHLARRASAGEAKG